MRALLVASVLLFVAAAPAEAQLSALPALSGPVNDIAGVMDDASALELDARIRALKSATGDVVIVTTVPTIAPYATIEEYAVKLFEKAGIGDKKLDNGLLVLVAVKEHAIRIEVGYGLEGFVTDGFSGDTIRQFMAPEFKANRYGPGLLAGTTHLIDRITEGRKDPAAFVPKPQDKSSLWLGLILFLVICLGVLGIILFVISRIAKATGGARATPAPTGVLGSGSVSSDDDKSRSSSSSSSSSSGSSFDGFGGGSSGGGGASGSW
jgi:uncharacterized protein